MQTCPFCGSELPLNARFCGNCGRARSSITAIDSVAHLRNSPPVDVQPRAVSTASSASPPPLDEEKVEQLVKIPTTTVSETAVVFGNAVTSTCVLNAPIVDEQLQGTFSSHNTFSGTVNYPKETFKCDVQGAEFFRYASTGTWSGQIVVS